MADYNSDRTGSNIDLTLDKVDALDAKVQPTATGANVTGTITADGLKIANSTYITQNDGISSNPRMLGMNSAGTTYIGPIDSYRGGSIFYGASPNVTNQFFYTGGSERARIDSSGNLLVGKTSTGVSAQGFGVYSSGAIEANGGNSPSAYFNRMTSDGEIVNFRKDGATVGSISSRSGNFALESGDVGLHINNGIDSFYPSNGTGSVKNGAVDLGFSGARFKDLYLSGGVYLGGTDAVNKLDDYETGTWTPVLKSSGNAIMTLSAANGYYTKVGNKVTGWFECEASVDLTDPNYYTIEGIPFSISTNHANSKHIGSANSAQTTTSRGLMHSLQYINSASLRVFVHSDGTTNKNFDYSDAIYGTFTYFVA